jgi:hypothetical protein
MRILIFAAVLLTSVALAAEPVVCSVAVATGAASSTSSPTTGACSWVKGATVLMQCDVAVYFDSQVGGTATSADAKADFASNSDPVPVYLDAFDKDISLLATASAGTCKFMTTKRRKPW